MAAPEGGFLNLDLNLKNTDVPVKLWPCLRGGYYSYC